MRSRGIITTAGLLLAVTAIASPSGHTSAANGAQRPSARRAPAAVIVPYYDEVVPDGPPVVVPILTCVRRVRGGMREVVFGYDNTGDVSVHAPLDELNNTVTGGISGAQARPTQLLPGRHPYSFSVRYRPNDPPTWTFLSPDRVDVSYPDLWSVSITPTKAWSRARSCDKNVPTRFANVQQAQTGFGATNIIREGGGATSHIDSYDVQLGPTTITVGCTGRGQGRLDDVLYGWGLTGNIGPVDDDQAVAVERGTNTFLVTTDDARPVEDSDDRAWMSEMSNDVSASCVYRDGTVVAAPVYWEDRIGELFSIEQQPFDDDWFLVLRIDAPGGIRVR